MFYVLANWGCFVGCLESDLLESEGGKVTRKSFKQAGKTETSKRSANLGVLSSKYIYALKCE